MKKAIRFQLKNAICSTGFLSISIIMVIFSLGCFVISCIAEYGNDITSVAPAQANFFFNGFYNSVYTRIFFIILPFAACAAFSDSYVTDFANNRLAVLLARFGAKKYYFSKMTAVFLCGAFVIFLPQVLNYILCSVTFPLHSTNDYGWDLWQSYTYCNNGLVGCPEFLFKRLYIFSPYLYFILYMLISSLAAGLMAVTAYQFSFFIRNRIFAISIMFIILNLAGMLPALQSVSIEYYIFGCSAGGNTYIYFILTLAIYVVLAVLPTSFALKRLKNCL